MKIMYPPSPLAQPMQGVDNGILELLIKDPNGQQTAADFVSMFVVINLSLCIALPPPAPCPPWHSDQ